MATSTETSPVRPMRADARRNRERVLVAAREAFAQLGMDAQMDDVARRAGVGVGTVYRHFPTKDELVIALAEQFFQRLAEIGREESARDTSAWDAFTTMLRRGAALNARDLAMQDVILRGIGNEVVDAAKRELSDITSALMERAKAEGKLREDMEVEDIGPIMCGVTASSRIPTAGDNGWKRHLELVLAGMRAGQGPPLPPR